MEITILLFDRMTALDAVGPYEVLAALPGAAIRFAAKTAGPVTVDNGPLRLVATHALDEIDRSDLLLVPGGLGTPALEEDGPLLDWLRRVHRTTRFTTSVCTGSLVLGAAGLLDGVRATTHWALHHRLAGLGAVPVHERVVTDGRIVTAAGVSAGIDMALTLAVEIAGPAAAQAIQLGIEYDPAPPFDAGAPHKAPPEVLAAVRSRIEDL